MERFLLLDRFVSTKFQLLMMPAMKYNLLWQDWMAMKMND
ncbi:hypothetical protein SP21_73 [Salmonella phage 21]|nr:hypothetical protein SP21_73 [Salmonella phage 21]